MRYKEQTLVKLGRLTNTIRKIESEVKGPNPTQNSILQQLEETLKQVEDIRGMVSIEHDEFQNYR